MYSKRTKHKCAQEINYLHENIDLRFGIEIRFYCGSHGLFQMQCELGRFVVSWPTFSVAPAECGHTVLTVDQRTVVGRFGPVDSNLNNTHAHKCRWLYEPGKNTGGGV